MEDPSSRQVARDLRWLWFDLHYSHFRSKHGPATQGDLAQALPELETALADTAKANRRAATLLVTGVVSSFAAVAAWRGFIEGVIFPLNDAGRIGGETQWWIAAGTVWIPFALLIVPGLLALVSLTKSLRLSGSLGSAYSALGAMSPAERAQLRAQVDDDSRLAHLMSANRRWRELLAE